MEGHFFLTGILIGILFGVPAGAIGALTIKHTLENGFVAGMVTGLGSSVADVIYACVGLLGISVVTQFLSEKQQILRIVGGIFIIIYGMSMLKQTKQKRDDRDLKKGYVICFTESFAIAILNPITVTTFFIAFSSFGVDINSLIREKLLLVFGVLTGTMLWWLTLSGAIYWFREKLLRWLPMINKAIGIVLMIIGSIMLI
ncbi:MAG: LysE family transporter [bacterium]|nr:LysE family transporter [bacterium]